MMTAERTSAYSNSCSLAGFSLVIYDWDSDDLSRLQIFVSQLVEDLERVLNRTGVGYDIIAELCGGLGRTMLYTIAVRRCPRARPNFNFATELDLNNSLIQLQVTGDTELMVC